MRCVDGSSMCVFVHGVLVYSGVFRMNGCYAFDGFHEVGLSMGYYSSLNQASSHGGSGTAGFWRIS
jgi:hypothetical protein